MKEKKQKMYGKVVRWHEDFLKDLGITLIILIFGWMSYWSGLLEDISYNVTVTVIGIIFFVGMHLIYRKVYWVEDKDE